MVVEAAVDKVLGVEQYTMQVFVDALDMLPMALAENNELQPH